MFTSLEDIYIHYKFIKESIDKYKLIEDYILQLFNNDIVDLDTNDELKLLWNGIYYQNKIKDYSKTKQYYQMAIDVGNDNAMANLGRYYQEVEKDYELMKQYYQMAIDAGNSDAMNNLGNYYEYVEKNYVLMKQYYLMAIDKGNLYAMHNLNNYYANDKLEFYKELIKIENKNDLILNKINELEQLEQIQIYKNDKLELYKKLIKIENKNDLILNEINELEQLKPIRIYKNKVRLFTRLNNYAQCVLCLEDNVINIDLSCGHEVCIDCYNSNLKCTFNYCNKNY